MAKKAVKPRQRGLVLGYVERVSSGAFERYSEVITELVGGKNGIYALYRKTNLYYVGLATDLRKRVRHHLRDRHAGKWNYFSLYLVRSERHLKDLESLAIRIAHPRGNVVRGKPRAARDLKRLLRRKMTQQAKEEIARIFGRPGKAVAEAPSDKERAERHKRAGRKAVATLRRRATAAKGRRSPELGPKASKHHKSPVGVPLKGLIRNKRLRGTYKGEDWLAWVLPSGRIKLRHTGDIYDSPSGAAGAIKGRATNGWAFWRYLNDTHEWVPLTTLRKKQS